MDQDPPGEPQSQHSSPELSAALRRSEPGAWDAIGQYVHLSMTMDKLHQQLEASLGPAFLKDVSFWNDIINEVTPEEGGAKVAVPIYQRLCKHYDVSIYNCSIEK